MLRPTSNKKLAGLTLVELLIAMAMTLIVLGAMMSAFRYGSTEMQKGRAMIEMTNRLVSVESLLRADLQQLTVELRPQQLSSALPKGYFEIVDGARRDYTAISDPFDLVFGDNDDFFAGTVRSQGKPFRGRMDNQIIESQLAEVVWFTLPSPNPGGGRTLFRKVRVVNPLISVTLSSPADAAAFYLRNRFSVYLVDPRPAGSSVVTGGNLETLALRANRLGHLPGVTPQTSGLNFVSTAANPLSENNLVDAATDDDILISLISAFDIRVFDPNTVIRVRRDVVSVPQDPVRDLVEPGDFMARNESVNGVNFPNGGQENWSPNNSTATTSYVDGAFVDLPPVASYGGEAVYDTGTSQYDRDVANDRGANGVDDDGDGAIDEEDERTAIIPFDSAIRGLRITLRVFEPITRQVRQLSVVKSFVSQ